MGTYVIVGINPQGLSKFGRRNIPANYRESVIASYVAAGWTEVEAIRETF